MEISFDFQDTLRNAIVVKCPGNKINVEVKDNNLKEQFGSSFQFHLTNNDIYFEPLNPAHSELYALQSRIKNAIAEHRLLLKNVNEQK